MSHKSIYDAIAAQRLQLKQNAVPEPYEVRISRETYKLLCIEMGQPWGIVTHVDGMELRVFETLEVAPK